MLIELFIVFQVAAITSFFLAFFFRHEILWLIAFALSGFLMLNSFNVETSNGSHSYPYLMGINLLFFALSLLLGLYDMFDKYGQSVAENKAEDDDISLLEENPMKIPALVTSKKRGRGRPRKDNKI